MSLVTPRGRGLGRRPDKIDPRDRLYSWTHRSNVLIPAAVDLEAKFPPCFDQGDTSSCGPNSASAMMCGLCGTMKPFSRLQIYWGVRALEGDVRADEGVETRDLFRVLQLTGAAPEDAWPFDKKKLFTEPTDEVYSLAEANTIETYSRLNSANDYLQCLAQGFAFILGFTVFESLDSDEVAKSGVLPMPRRGEKDLGGHDVLVVGYDTDFLNNPAFLKSGVSTSKVTSVALKIRNSWGTGWGLNGHFWMPIDYADDDVNGGDAWTGRLETKEVA